jgi:hypothetical protein
VKEASESMKAIANLSMGNSSSAAMITAEGPLKSKLRESKPQLALEAGREGHGWR